MDDEDDDDDPHGDEKGLPALSLSKQSKMKSRTSHRVTSSSPRGLKYDESGDAKAVPTAKFVPKDEASKPRSDGRRAIGKGDDDLDAQLR